MHSSDFADYIMYVRGGDDNSEAALSKIRNSSNIHVQDVDELSRPLPTWLRGVPTIVHKETGRCYRGTACMQHIAGIVEPHGIPSQSGSIGNFGDGSFRMTGAGFAPAGAGFEDVGGPAGVGGPGVAGPGEGGNHLPPPQRPQRNPNHVQSSQVENYMAQRQSMDPPRQTAMA